MDVKTFFGSPEGAAAVNGLVRALLLVATGFGATITTPQATSILAATTTAMVIVSLLMSGVTVATVRSRADTEEVTAAVTGQIGVENNATPQP